MTGFSVRALASMCLGLVVGFVFSAALLLYVGFYMLMLLYLVTGIDAFDFQGDLAKEPLSLGGVCGGVVAFVVWLCALAYLGPHSLIRFRRRFGSRLHVLAGRPLASIEGPPLLDPSSESGYLGLQIGDHYFNFDDCWLNVTDEELAALAGARGMVRVWYVPIDTPPLPSPATGKLVHYDCVLARADWRP